VEALIPLGAFFLLCGSSVSAKFLIYGAHAICFCILVAILDPLFKHTFNQFFCCLMILHGKSLIEQILLTICYVMAMLLGSE
jgi:hypothetical protein